MKTPNSENGEFWIRISKVCKCGRITRTIQAIGFMNCGCPEAGSMEITISENSMPLSFLEDTKNCKGCGN